MACTVPQAVFRADDLNRVSATIVINTIANRLSLYRRGLFHGVTVIEACRLGAEAVTGHWLSWCPEYTQQYNGKDDKNY